jgi:hypothetical protein
MSSSENPNAAADAVQYFKKSRLVMNIILSLLYNSEFLSFGFLIKGANGPPD